MEIQSASVVVPTHNGCVNKCKFCVSRTHSNLYEDRISKSTEFKWFKSGEFWKLKPSEYSVIFKDYKKRLQFARNNGCNVVILTGTGEPIQDIPFIDFFMKINSLLDTPFENIEIQTTGVLLNDDILSHFRNIGITTIAFSISNIFDNERNLELIGCNEKLTFDVYDIIKLVKKYDFNLRLSYNLVNDYDNYTVDQVLNKSKELGADQVTFRKLYKSNNNSEIDKWIEDNACKHFYNDVIDYIKKLGLKHIAVLPFGAKIYDINEMSICIDDDCMSEIAKDTYKYIILRENARAYYLWHTKASLIF